MHQTVPWCFGATLQSITFIADGNLPPSVTCLFLMTNSASSEKLVQQIQNGLYVVTVCLHRLNSILFAGLFGKAQVFLYGSHYFLLLSKPH
jgi:hypothetical protein